MTLRYSSVPNSRQLQVSEQIRGVLSAHIMDMEISIQLNNGGDQEKPRNTTAVTYKENSLLSPLITILEVRISKDLRIATAFFTAIFNTNITFSKGEQVTKIEKMLNSNAYVFRKIIASKLSHMRYCPEIRFVASDKRHTANIF